jgi:hypothetical protein
VSLPQKIRVRISSEDADGIGLSPVVAQDMPFEELMLLMLAIAGKDASRIGEIISRGSLVSGASRFRWAGFDVLESELKAHLLRYPDPDPSLPFVPDRCFLAIIHAGPKQLSLEREAGRKRRFLRRRSFWDELIAAVAAPQYLHYSYKDRSDVFTWRPDAPAQQHLQSAAKLLPYSAWESQMRVAGVSLVHLYTRR